MRGVRPFGSGRWGGECRRRGTSGMQAPHGEGSQEMASIHPLRPLLLNFLPLAPLFLLPLPWAPLLLFPLPSLPALRLCPLPWAPLHLLLPCLWDPLLPTPSLQAPLPLLPFLRSPLPLFPPPRAPLLLLFPFPQAPLLAVHTLAPLARSQHVVAQHARHILHPTAACAIALSSDPCPPAHCSHLLPLVPRHALPRPRPGSFPPASAPWPLSQSIEPPHNPPRTPASGTECRHGRRRTHTPRRRALPLPPSPLHSC